MPCGHSGVDSALEGGFRSGGIHEFFTASAMDAPAAVGIALALAARARADSGAEAIWIGRRGATRLCPRGIVELAGTMPIGLKVSAADAMELLIAAHRAASGPGLVVVEANGRFPAYDLTASRRLHLAAEKSGSMLLLLRIAAEPVPSAAFSRWRVGSAPSAALDANAPGPPTFDLTLLRQRGGPSGLSWRVEWDRDAGCFRDAALPGAVVPASSGRAAPAAGLRLAG